MSSKVIPRVLSKRTVPGTFLSGFSGKYHWPRYSKSSNIVQVFIINAHFPDGQSPCVPVFINLKECHLCGVLTRHTTKSMKAPGEVVKFLRLPIRD